MWNKKLLTCWTVTLPLVLGGVSIAVPASAGTIRQVNPAVKAPALINDADHQNEYPWFSNNGHLFIWTRQCHENNPDPCLNHDPPIGVNTQWLWVSYLKNFDTVWKAPHDDQNLPALQFATPVELHPVNHAVIQRFSTGHTIKALAVCDRTGDQPITGTDGLIRYRFSLFMAIGLAGESNPRSLWRADKIIVTIDPNDNGGEIVPSRLRFNGELVEVTGSDSGMNETEPALTRDGKYLFWASSGWTNGKVAEYIGGEGFARCSQVDQGRQSYANLPDSGQRFAWKDQYLPLGNTSSTSRTNYHTVVERSHVNDEGATALIFEKCHGQVLCQDGGLRDCECLESDANNDDKDDRRLWTTGFDASGGPYPIENCNGCSGNAALWKTQPKTESNPTTQFRSTHPAIAGPEYTTAGRDGWLLFFMRGKKIWYTKIAEVP